MSNIQSPFRKSSHQPQPDEEPLLESDMASTADPFYTVRDNVNSQVERIKVKNEKFQDLVQTINTATSPEFKDLRKNLFKDLRTVEKDLKGLKGAVDMIDKNRQKFPHIQDYELTKRRRFVDESQSTVNMVKGQMDSLSVRQKMEADEKLSKSTNRDSYDESTELKRAEIAKDNNRFVQDQRLQTRQTIDQQV